MRARYNVGSNKPSDGRRGVDEIPKLVRKIYQIVGELEHLFPGRRFTPDGHLVGSIGEVLAQDMYDLELLPPGFKTHDAKSRQGKPRLGKSRADQEAPPGLVPRSTA